MEESQHIIQVGYNEQEEENSETDILGTLHELIARLAACNDFVKEEEHMSAIQCRNRKNVHERQNNAQESGHHPESVPIPHRREQAAQGSETTQTLGTFLGEDILHIAYIARQYIPTILDTRRETLEEAVADMGNLVILENRMIIEAKLHTVLGRLQHDIVLQCIARRLEIGYLSCQCLHAVLMRRGRGENIIDASQFQLEFIERIHLLAIQSENLITLAKPSLLAGESFITLSICNGR